MEREEINQRTVTETNRENIPIEVEDIKVSDQRRKLHYSVWHLVVNSNKTPESTEHANDLAQIMKDAILNTFQKHAREVFKIIPPAKEEFNNETIKKIKIKQAAEIGTNPQGGRVHVHALITVTHITLLQINIQKMRELICGYMAEKGITHNCYINLKWVPSTQPLENYIEKTPLNKNTNVGRR